jgi:uncharacterized protein YqiB (DUF1249 family)
MKYFTDIVDVFMSSPPNTYHRRPQIALQLYHDTTMQGAMAARVGLGHLLDNFEDLRWPSSPFGACF